MTAAEKLRLRRLLRSAAAGRSGVNLADLNDEEALKILSRRQPCA